MATFFQLKKGPILLTSHMWVKYNGNDSNTFKMLYSDLLKKEIEIKGWVSDFGPFFVLQYCVYLSPL